MTVRTETTVIVDVDQTPTADEESRLFETQEQRRERLGNDSAAQDMEERKRYAGHAYGITQSWIGFLIVLTLAQLSLKPFGLGLSQPEFITVFTTTTASIFGFWLLVGRYLFPGRS